VKKLKAAGFGRFKETHSASTPEMKDKVLGTNPAANQTAAITNEISVIVGSGPATKQVPEVAGQTVDLAQKNLTVYGFSKFSQSAVDSPRPAGDVIGTNPPAGATVPVDTVIDLQVSKGNQFIMPDLTGLFWTDAYPQLQSLGWTGVLVKGADVDAGGSQHNRVVSQSPSPGQGVNKDGNITLKFGQ
jgi:beta-lactam-binding protein with PASTA domain